MNLFATLTHRTLLDPLTRSLHLRVEPLDIQTHVLHGTPIHMCEWGPRRRTHCITSTKPMASMKSWCLERHTCREVVRKIQGCRSVKAYKFESHSHHMYMQPRSIQGQRHQAMLSACFSEPPRPTAELQKIQATISITDRPKIWQASAQTDLEQKLINMMPSDLDMLNTHAAATI